MLPDRRLCTFGRYSCYPGRGPGKFGEKKIFCRLDHAGLTVCGTAGRG